LADNPLAPSTAGGAPTEIPFADFELAVFENKFTSLHREAPPPSGIDGLKHMRAGGRCDVIVYGPEVNLSYPLKTAAMKLALPFIIPMDKFTPSLLSHEYSKTP